MGPVYARGMANRSRLALQASHTVTLPCGCLVYVSCHPHTGVAHTRIIERRGAGCRERLHDVGVRLQAKDRFDIDRRPDERYDPCRVRR